MLTSTSDSIVEIGAQSYRPTIQRVLLTSANKDSEVLKRGKKRMAQALRSLGTP
jgi:hypothetical protein